MMREANDLPSFIVSAVEMKKTSMGDNEAFPSVMGNACEMKLLTKHMDDVSSMLARYGYDGMSIDEMMSEVSELTKRCSDLEKPIRPFLEKLCLTSVNRIFAIPPSIVNIECKLVDKIECGDGARLTPEDDDSVSYTYYDMDDMVSGNKAVLKRRVVNALVLGAAYMYSNEHRSYYKEIVRMEKELPKLYDKINVLNDYLSFVVEEEMSELKPSKQGSYVTTKLDVGEEKVSIKAQGLIFPLLLRETIRGLFELFASHGLPDDKELASLVLKKADFLMAEPWDMRIGIPLWEDIAMHIGDDTALVPYFFMELVKLPCDGFNEAIRETILGTRKGERIIDEIVAVAEDNVNYQEFERKMDNGEYVSTIMQDGYLSSSDLDALEIRDEEETIVN